MRVIYFSPNMKYYTAASYQQDFIDALSKKIKIVFWGPGYEGFDRKLSFNQVKRKINISDNDVVIVGHAWLSDIPINFRNNSENFYSWIDDKIIDKKKFEYCGEIDFFNHKGKKIFFINKEYISLKEKLDFIKKNKFDHILTASPNFKKFISITGMDFIYFPYAIKSDFFLNECAEKKYDIFFSGLIENNYIHKKDVPTNNFNRKDIMDIFFYNLFLIPLKKKKKFKLNKIIWNSYTGNKYNDLVLKLLKKYKRYDYSNYKKKLAESKVTINFISPHNLVGPRFFETMASKSICLCEEANELSYVFKSMHHYVGFNDKKDFFEKLEFSLSDSMEIKKIINNAYSLVKNFHTYDIRAEQILKLCLK